MIEVHIRAKKIPAAEKLISYHEETPLWALRDSNPRPSACKADALNQLSYAPKLLLLNQDLNLGPSD